MRKSNRSALLLLLATVLLFGLELTVILSGGPDWLGATAGLLSYALAAFAALYVARVRGHSRIWAVLGVLNFLGVLIVFCFRDRAVHASTDAAAPRELFGRPEARCTVAAEQPCNEAPSLVS